MCMRWECTRSEYPTPHTPDTSFVAVLHLKMAANFTASASQFLKLPDDVLLEILSQLPAVQVVLRCRLVSSSGSTTQCSIFDGYDLPRYATKSTKYPEYGACGCGFPTAPNVSYVVPSI